MANVSIYRDSPEKFVDDDCFKKYVEKTKFKMFKNTKCELCKISEIFH